jgi:hypothetical protein
MISWKPKNFVSAKKIYSSSLITSFILIAEIFQIFENFPTTLQDPDILIQISNMTKYKVKNRQIIFMRAQKRSKVLHEIQSFQCEIKESHNNSLNRSKFLNKFYLYGGIVKRHIAKKEGTNHN